MTTSLTHVTSTVTQVRQDLAPNIPLFVHLVQGPDGAALVDAGLPASAPMIDDLIEQGSVDAAGGLRFLCNTHPHHDHIGNLRRLRAAHGSAVVAVAAGRSWIEDTDRNLREFAFHHPYIIGESPELLAELAPTFDGPCPVDILVDETVTLNLGGGVELEAFRVDGHVHAELAWFERSTHCLILGDAVTGTDWPLFHGHVDPTAFRSTLHKLRSFTKDRSVVTVVMSHYTSRSAEEFLILLDRVETYLDEIDELVRRQVGRVPVSLERVWRQVCTLRGKEPEFRALAMVNAHLSQLLADGVIRLAESEQYVLSPSRSEPGEAHRED